MAKTKSAKSRKSQRKAVLWSSPASRVAEPGNAPVRILDLFFLPPNAIARLGGSASPLESYAWGEDPTIAGRAQTIIVPDVSFDVIEDGSIRPYLPANIRFRDGSHFRPVAPFFELWAKVLADGVEKEQPVTISLLQSAAASPANLAFRVTAGNKKAERRCNDPACGFGAQVVVVGTDHARTPLLASSPNTPNSQPLVSFDKPIRLGHFQVIRPIEASEMGVDLSIVRVRFTPATGEVYGPPTATVGQAPGTDRSHVMVKPENRILNPQALWAQYDANSDQFRNPQPSDTYDGSDTDQERSWGVVDDTCDALIECDLVIDGVRVQAQARVAVGPPHFAPDRRPFVSLADDLKDRDETVPDGGETQEELEVRINDLFQRALEVASLVNVDANRARAIATNGDTSQNQVANTPRTDQEMMTALDKPYADLTTAPRSSVPHARLPLSDLVQEAHGSLVDLDSMVAKLREEADRIRLIIRPPYGNFLQLSVTPAAVSNPRFRDPRIPRDTEYDMRMPPFMRDSDATAMSLTHRQYAELMALVSALEAKQTEFVASATTGGVAGLVHHDTPIRRRVAAFIKSRNQIETAAKQNLLKG